jgi:hypothetical protein
MSGIDFQNLFFSCVFIATTNMAALPLPYACGALEMAVSSARLNAKLGRRTLLDVV